MSLKITNHITDKQRAILEKLEYIGTWKLTVNEAAVIIDELFEEQRLSERDDDLNGFNNYKDYIE